MTKSHVFAISQVQVECIGISIWKPFIEGETLLICKALIDLKSVILSINIIIITNIYFYEKIVPNLYKNKSKIRN